jgi:CheY-like chemotaxis protein
MSTWMVIEDEPDLYEMILAMYAALGVGGVAFVTGEEAIEWLEEVERGAHDVDLPELALIDIRLPGDVSGIEISAKLRSSPLFKNLVIVLMTAYKLSPQEEDQAIEAAGADNLMYKPLPRFVELEQMLNRLVLARRRANTG